MGRRGIDEADAAAGRAHVRPATRQSPARFSDLRLWLGVGLLVLSATGGFLLLSRGEETVTLWRATRDLAAGSIPTGLEPVVVSSTLARAGYAGPQDTIAGRLRWPIAAGALVPIAAVDGRPPTDTRQVTVPVDPLHAPVALQGGDLVDVWTMPRPDSASAAAKPSLVLSSALVIGVGADAVGMSGELAVVLEVGSDEVAPVVAATRVGVVDLVAVPPGTAELTS